MRWRIWSCLCDSGRRRVGRYEILQILLRFSALVFLFSAEHLPEFSYQRSRTQHEANFHIQRLLVCVGRVGGFQMRRYFCTGATGFIGREIVRQLLQREDTQAIVCLTRGKKQDAIENRKVQYWLGDIEDCVFPQGIKVADDDCVRDLEFTDLIHGANDSAFGSGSYYNYYSMVEGTARIAEWAQRHGLRRALLLSSGGISRNTLYAQGKRQSELIAKANFWKIARIHATIGPEAPLTGPFSIGQFVGSACRGESIQCWGPSAVRSYMDVTDCARWLLEILGRGFAVKPIDVGGAVSMRVGDAADLVGEVFGVPVLRQDDSGREDSYVPDLTAAKDLGLMHTLTLRQSLERIRAATIAVRNPDLESLQRI